MKLFISWSGEFSKKVAECLNSWIQIIIQTVDVFYSPDDIEKGENWSNRLSKELEQSNFGIVYLTPENIMAPWIHFEAGALSKATHSRVSVIMLGISPSDIKGPLACFQNTAFNRKDFYRLFQSINNSLEHPLNQSILDLAFDNAWEKLEHDISSIIDEYSFHIPTPALEETNHNEDNNNSETMQEILRTVRSLNNCINTTVHLSPPRADSSSPSDEEEIYYLTVSCDSSIVDDVFPVVDKYTKFSSAESKTIFQNTLSDAGQCAIPVNINNVLPLYHALKKVGAGLHFSDV